MESREMSTVANHRTRAQRFAILMPIQFRRPGQSGWLDGRVENISRSGVLFAAPQLVEVRALLDLSFELPAEIGGEAGAVVICRGEVTRRVAPATSEGPAALATRILEYRLVRGGGGSVV